MGKNILKANERINPVTELTLGERKGKLENKERKEAEKRNRNLEKRIVIAEDENWRECISDDKLDEIVKEVPQKEWHKLSFYEQILKFLERERIQSFQGLNI